MAVNKVYLCRTRKRTAKRRHFTIIAISEEEVLALLISRGHCTKRQLVIYDAWEREDISVRVRPTLRRLVDSTDEPTYVELNRSAEWEKWDGRV